MAVETSNLAGSRFIRLAWVLLILNAFSALLFIGIVNRPVFDDSNNFPDVSRYAKDGVSVSSVRKHINPTGPTSFIWMAIAVRFIGGSSLRDARIAVLLSWLLLGIGLFIGAHYSSFPNLWYAALIVSLAFPHTLTATATVLTEGPAFLFGTLGVLLWLESAVRPKFTAWTGLAGVIGGFLMGLAVTSRQYYLALLPAAALFAIYKIRQSSSADIKNRSASFFLSLLAAAFPVVVLVLVWKGLSSPAMVSGASYGAWKSKVGLNLWRPFVAIFYITIYLIPLTFPAIPLLPSRFRRGALLCAVLVGTAAGLFHSSLLQPGPLQSLTHFGGKLPGGEFILVSLFAVAATYNAIALGSLILEKRATVFSSDHVIFAFLVVMFFIAEQIGVGGNIPFYELYVLQIAPFLGLIAFGLLPQLTTSRIAAIASLSVVSHALLWRHAMGG